MLAPAVLDGEAGERAGGPRRTAVRLVVRVGAAPVAGQVVGVADRVERLQRQRVVRDRVRRLGHRDVPPAQPEDVDDGVRAGLRRPPEPAYALDERPGGDRADLRVRERARSPTAARQAGLCT